MEEFETEPIKRNWWYIISPCVIAGILAVLMIIEGALKGGWSILGVLVGIPFLAAMIVIDFIIKLLVKHKSSRVWLVETILIAATVLFISLRFPYLF